MEGRKYSMQLLTISLMIAAVLQPSVVQSQTLFVSPELIQLSEWKETLSGSVVKSKLSLVAIDEAHCISEWGHDFRTAFCKIGALRALTRVPFMALTASAPSDVQYEITDSLHMSTPVIISCNLDRPNIYLSSSQVKTMNRDLEKLIQNLNSISPAKTIVYAHTKDAAWKVYHVLQKSVTQKSQVAFYHADLTQETKSYTYQNFLPVSSSIKCLVATIAFGMGMDIPNVEVVIVYGTPSSITQLYQLFGRAGRDGSKAQAHLFYNKTKRGVDEKVEKFYNPKATPKVCRRKILLEGVGASTYGKEFYIGFMSSTGGSSFNNQRLTIGTPAPYAEFVVDSKYGVIYNGTVNSTVPAVINVPAILQVTSNGYSNRDKGIHIYSIGNNASIFVIVEVSFFTLNHGTYIAYPFMKFEGQTTYEYFVISTGDQSSYYSSEFLLIGCENETLIMITPSQTINVPENLQLSMSNKTTINENNTSHQLVLHQGQTLLVKQKDDLSGTKITSNKPLTLISGHECANVPLHASGCEPMAIQVPPVATWGKQFLLAPFAGRSSKQTFKAISSKQDTIISLVCDNNVTKISHTNSVFTHDTDKYCYLEATFPILLVQLSPGYTIDNKGDPTISMIAPIDQYLDEIEFILLPTSVFQSSFVSITVPAGHSSPNSLLLDDTPINCEWHHINNIFNTTIGYGCSKAFTDEVSMPTQHKIHHSGGLLSVVVYGFKQSKPSRGYAYLSGQHIQVTTPSSPDILEDNILYDLTSFPGVKELERVSDSSSDAIYIPRGLVFGSEYVTFAYVNENGVISFQNPWSFHEPEKFPTQNYEIRQSLGIAPFWSDNDIRKAGAVRYVSYNYQQNDSSSPGRKLLDKINKKVQETDMQFTGKWILIAHWDHVHPSPHGDDDHKGISETELDKTNNYQIIIITNSTYTYAIFTYPCGEMQWSSVGTNKAAVVGYNAKSNFFYNHPLSGRHGIEYAVSCTNPGRRRKRNENNDDTCGLTEINCEEAINMNVPIIAQMCKCSNKLNNTDSNLITNVLQSLDHCPPTRQLAMQDVGRFVKQDDKCYVSGRRVVMNNISFTQQCCYDDAGSLVIEHQNQRYPGTLLLQHPLYDADNYETGDKSFRETCCSPPLSEVYLQYCTDFLSERPINNGTQYSPPILATGLGDPHYWTFDVDTFDDYHTMSLNLNDYYTFNGDGDFVLLELLSDSGTTIFTLQGRLGLVPLFSVTTHQGFAFGHSNFALQVSLKPVLSVFKTKPGIPSNITSQLITNIRWFDSNEEVMVMKEENTITASFFKFGIVLIATMHDYGSNSKFFNIMLKVPQTFAGKTRGFFGNFDGDATNDIHRRGETTPIYPLTDDNLLEPLKTWNVSTEESMFMDTPNDRKKRQTEENAYVPLFFNQLNFTDEQIAICEGSYPCLFDLAVTGDKTFAGHTKEDEKIANETNTILSNLPPSIFADNQIRITLGEEIIFNITVEDPGDNFTLYIEGEKLDGSTLEEIETGKYVFRWTLTEIVTHPLVFIANDTKGATSTFIPTVYICACINNGNCTLSGPSSGRAMIVMNCSCNKAFSGQFCEEDRNGCAEFQCFEGVECKDVPSPGIGADCGPCPLGFTGDGENKCYDIDECLMNDVICEQNCTNTYGSFTCGCLPGYTLTDDTKCEDINECDNVKLNYCQQLCENTYGSYNCSCNNGFILADDGRSCIASEPCNGECSYGCAVMDGKEECYCPIGFSLSESTCIDKNECLNSPCDQQCINTNGSFECLCTSGYKLLEDGITCEDVDECLEAALNAENLCDVNNECINKEGLFDCVCVPGYEHVNESCQRIQNEVPPAPPPVAVPTNGIENSVNYSTGLLTPETFTSKIQQLFKEITVRNINQFCSQNVCQLVSSQGIILSIKSLVVEPLNIAIPNSLIYNKEGLKFTLYVQLSDGFLAKEELQYALEQSEEEYIDAFILSTTAVMPTTIATKPITTTEPDPETTTELHTTNPETTTKVQPTTTDLPTTESKLDPGISCAAAGFVGCCTSSCLRESGCWCDKSCHALNDCCEDIAAIGCYANI